MFAIIGANGNVGYSTSAALRTAGARVRAIVRDSTKAARLAELGCEIAIADIRDSAALAKALSEVDSVQIVVPVSPRDPDPAADLRRSITSLIEALAQARPARVLAISDYGAHVAFDIGMPSIFRELEAQLRRLDGHRLILRSAEHMHNWARVLAGALSSGTLTTFQDPVAMVQPTIAAQDLGQIAAELLLAPQRGHAVQIIHAEAARRYSASDVATALSELSGQTIQAQAVPRSQWREIFERTLPATLAELLIKANDAKNQGGLVDVEPDVGEVRYGKTTLIDALRPLVDAQRRERG